MPAAVTYKESRHSEVLEDRLLALVCHSIQPPHRYPDRNSISWQDMYVMYQPANLLTQQGDARGVYCNPTSVWPPLHSQSSGKKNTKKTPEVVRGCSWFTHIWFLHVFNWLFFLLHIWAAAVSKYMIPRWHLRLQWASDNTCGTDMVPVLNFI